MSWSVCEERGIGSKRKQTGKKEGKRRGDGERQRDGAMRGHLWVLVVVMSGRR